MRSAKAVFLKQWRDTLKNRMILLQFMMMPILAFIMTELVAKPSGDIPDGMFVMMFAAMFVGMAPLTTTAGAIAEDRERKSLRFLVMAGVKQHEYLLGVGGFVLLVCSVVSVLMGLISGYHSMELVKFILLMILGSATSILLGAAIGIFSKNQQTATAISVPVFMVFAFFPMIAQFNETVEKAASILYTQQINAMIYDLSGPGVKPMLIIIANLAAFVVLFALAYKKKGLRG